MKYIPEHIQPLPSGSKPFRFKNIPLIYFSANSNIEQLAANAGANGYLAKPFDLDVLERTASNWLNK